MVAFSAQAMEMSVSGTAKITYVDEGEGSAGNTDVTGNPYGFDQTIGFNGSGDSPLGTVSLMHVANTNGSRSSSIIKIDMGDAGVVSLDGGVGNSGAGTIKDMMPRAAGAEQSWDDTDGDAYFIDTPSQGAWGYDNTIAGFAVSVGYAKNGGGNAGDDANIDAGSDSARSIAIKNAGAVDGVGFGFGMSETDSATSLSTIDANTAYLTYAIGPVTLVYRELISTILKEQLMQNQCYMVFHLTLMKMYHFLITKEMLKSEIQAIAIKKILVSQLLTLWVT